MIYYIVTDGYAHTMETFLTHWGTALRDGVSILRYDDLFSRNELPVGTYIFADLERLAPAELEMAADIWRQLEESGRGLRLLNHPRHAMRRFELLSTLADQGLNQFRVARASDKNATLRFPVFLREANEHGGSLTGRLANHTQLEGAIVPAMLRGHRVKDMLVIEYCDTADENGIFKKYSAFMVGETVIPCHVDHSCDWVVKDTDLVSLDIVDFERRYLEENPHEERLREIFKTARIDYGRIDYSLLDGEIQTWEINTNPVIALSPDEYQPFHLPVKRMFAAQMVPAMVAIQTDAEPDDVIVLTQSSELLKRMQLDRARARRTRSRRRFFRQAQRWAVVRFFRRILKPALGMVSPLIYKATRQ